MINIKSKEDILLESLIKYYNNNNNNLKSIVPIITGKSYISLRTIDWFITNFSLKNKTVYQIKKNNNTVNFNVHNSYKNQLKAFNKRYFDPFCRVNKNNIIKKIMFQIDDNQYIQTTIGQINFFKWAIEYNILDYILKNYDLIYSDMNKKEIKSIKNDTKIENKKKSRTTLLDINNTIIKNDKFNKSTINKNKNHEIIINKQQNDYSKYNFSIKL